MAEPFNRPAAVTDLGADPVYRPVSVLAIVGLVVAVLYTVIVVVGTLLSFRSGTPLLLNPLTSVGMPLVAIVLCTLARWQILSSEGTRAGLPMTRWGLWLSVVFGLGYVAFYAATYFAIFTDARDYSTAWLELVRKGRLNHAFLHTREPGIRQGVNPDDDKQMDIRFNPSMDPGRPGELTVFKQSELVRFIQFSGPDLEIRPQGVREWEFGGGRYRIKRIYQVSNKEGTIELNLVVSGSAGAKGEQQGRDWMVVWGESSIGQRTLSPWGEQAARLRGQSGDFLSRWCERLDRGRADEAVLALFEPEERGRLQAVYRTRLVLLNTLALTTAPDAALPASVLGRAAVLADPDWLVENYLPGCQEAVNRLVHLDPKTPLPADDNDSRQAVLSGLQMLFQPNRAVNRCRGGVPSQVSLQAKVVEQEGRRMAVTHDYLLGFLPRQQLAARITVVSGPGANDSEYRGGWRLARIEPVEAQDITKPRLRRIPTVAEPIMEKFPLPGPGKGPSGPPANPELP